MKIYPYDSIYNLLAIDSDGNKIFGRRVLNKMEAKSQIINHKDIMRIDKVIFNKKIYIMKDVFKWENNNMRESKPRYTIATIQTTDKELFDRSMLAYKLVGKWEALLKIAVDEVLENKEKYS